MTRSEIDTIYNKGSGLNGVPGDIQQAQRPVPWGALGNEAVSIGLRNPTVNDIRAIVDEMSNDKEWLKEGYQESTGKEYNRPHLEMFPDTSAHPYISTGPKGVNSDYYYNHPEQAGLDYYFDKQGLGEWFENQTLSPQGQDRFAEAMNLLEAMNNHTRKQDTYGSFLQDLVKENPRPEKDFNFHQGDYKKRPRARERHIE